MLQFLLNGRHLEPFLGRHYTYYHLLPFVQLVHASYYPYLVLLT